MINVYGQKMPLPSKLLTLSRAPGSVRCLWRLAKQISFIAVLEKLLPISWCFFEELTLHLFYWNCLLHLWVSLQFPKSVGQYKRAVWKKIFWPEYTLVSWKIYIGPRLTLKKVLRNIHWKSSGLNIHWEIYIGPKQPALAPLGDCTVLFSQSQSQTRLRKWKTTHMVSYHW